jgi:hypothetical protein
VYVDDLDAHFARAQAGGATIVSGIRQTGFRAYAAEDLEGHRWVFAQAARTSSDVAWPRPACALIATPSGIDSTGCRPQGHRTAARAGEFQGPGWQDGAEASEAAARGTEVGW